jgi:hypothetical protein
MAFERWAINETPIGPNNTADRRAAALREAEERASQRRDRLASQRSPLNAPEERIRLWETLHELKLPTSPNHQLLWVIAKQTDLSIQQVRDEQDRRTTPTVTAP